MPWTVDNVVDEDTWTREYAAGIISEGLLSPPERLLYIGATKTSWTEIEPGVAFTRVEGGNPADWQLARTVLEERLRGAGYHIAEFLPYPKEHRTADWSDIESKAARLIQSGNVNLARNAPDQIVANVVGDHGTYEVMIGREDPNSQAMTQWQCDCPWDQYAWGRTRQWKKYEGRPCAHVLAAWWASQSTPVDEDMMGDQPQTNLFDPGTAQPKGQPGMVPAPTGPPAPAGPQLSIPGVTPPDATLPAPTNIIPPFPGAPLEPPPVSVPGARQPTPEDPLNHPGGTYSSWKFADTEWDFGTQEHDGWKFVYSTADGKGLVGDPNSFHMELSPQLDGSYGHDHHSGSVQADGLVNVYYWPGKDPSVSLRFTMGFDRYPPRLLAWLKEQLPNVNVRYPADVTEMLEALDHGARIAAADDFTNAEMVRLNEAEYGVAEGKSEEHGAGQYQQIPKNSIGEVMGQDPTTGWVEVIFPLSTGPMEPFLLRAFIEPSKLTPMPGIAKPGPFIKRR